MPRTVWLGVLVAALAAGCREERRTGAAAVASGPRDAAADEPLVAQACACQTLGCIDTVQQRFVARTQGQHATPEALAQAEATRAGIDRCTSPLVAQLEHDITDVTDALCACADRACYDGLRDRVNAVFSRDNGAALPPAALERIRATVERFDACDRRFTP